MQVSDNITAIKAALPPGVRLVAVSKTHPADAIQEAYDAGQRIFGESRPQEMTLKHAALPSDIRWHMIGHLQRNKVRMIMPYVDMIHSVDSARLLQAIEDEAYRLERRVDVLLEVKIGGEKTKGGWEQADLMSFLKEGRWREHECVVYRGLMAIASNTADAMQLRTEFTTLKALHNILKKEYFGPQFDTLSMGMTHDWPLAVECGSTMVRIGSAIFGER